MKQQKTPQQPVQGVQEGLPQPFAQDTAGQDAIGEQANGAKTRPTGGLSQPGWDIEEEVTRATPTPWIGTSNSIRKQYLRVNMEPWQRSKGAVTKVITLKQIPPKNPGDLFGSHSTFWMLACPSCGSVAELNHFVSILGEAISMSPALECPVCRWHDVIQGWQLREPK